MEDFVFGRNNVLELLENSDRNVSKIILSENIKGSEKISQIIDLAKQKGIVFQFQPKEKIQENNNNRRS